MTNSDEDARRRAEAVLAEAEAERQRIIAEERRRDLEVAAQEQAALDDEDNS